VGFLKQVSGFGLWSADDDVKFVDGLGKADALRLTPGFFG